MEAAVTYKFTRAEGFYLLEIPPLVRRQDGGASTGDRYALDSVPRNPGTLRVENMDTATVLYDAENESKPWVVP